MSAFQVVVEQGVVHHIATFGAQPVETEIGSHIDAGTEVVIHEIVAYDAVLGLQFVAFAAQPDSPVAFKDFILFYNRISVAAQVDANRSAIGYGLAPVIL